MSPAASEDEGGEGSEGGEGPGFRYGDFLHAGENTADNVAAANEGDLRLAAAAGAAVAPRSASSCCWALSNKYTALLTADP